MAKHAQTLAMIACLSIGLSACGNQETSGEESSATPTETASSTSQSTESTAETSSSPEFSGEIQKAYETFGSLAPRSLFAAFDSCNPNGMENSVACSGSEVGQFQFFDSDAKAASTAQLLTQLRGSKVIEDDGDKLVGWSTLASNAIITVVDTDKGLVLQQMVSIDDTDPTERIYELELAEPQESESSESSVASESSESSQPSEEPSATSK